LLKKSSGNEQSRKKRAIKQINKNSKMLKLSWENSRKASKRKRKNLLKTRINFEKRQCCGETSPKMWRKSLKK